MPGDPNDLDAYLDRLLLELRGRTSDVRRVLAEVEEHLRDATTEGMRAGLTEEEAQQQAIARFGSPTTVARRFSPPSGPLPRPALGEMSSALILLLAVGLMAIGASGLVAIGFRATLGDRFVAADLPGVTYTPARCRDFLTLYPEAASCDRAAAAHHADEVEEYRVAAGAVGVAVLGGWLLLHRRARRRSPDRASWLPEEVLPAVGAAVFGLAGSALAVESANALAMDARFGGAGQWLSAAAVSLVVAAGFGYALLRTLRVRVAVTAR